MSRFRRLKRLLDALDEDLYGAAVELVLGLGVARNAIGWRLVREAAGSPEHGPPADAVMPAFGDSNSFPAAAAVGASAHGY
jgi:hypothetical protein